jgi:hypothetical protein
VNPTIAPSWISLPEGVSRKTGSKEQSRVFYGGGKMIRSYLAVALLLLLTLTVSVPSANTQQSQYPVLDKVAQKVIDKYQTSSCEDLKAQKEQPPDPQQAATKQKVVGMLKSDPKMREHFLNKVAAPIANKMFECGMIP